MELEMKMLAQGRTYRFVTPDFTTVASEVSVSRLLTRFHSYIDQHRLHLLWMRGHNTTRWRMGKVLKVVMVGITEFLVFLIGLAIAALLLYMPAYAGETPREQIKGLDEQVQEIKTDVLSIGTELNKLEEKLLYPSDTQIALFVSLGKEEKFRLDAVDIELDGKPVAHHLYTFKELEALQKGGVQRIYVGNVRTGDHPLRVTVIGKSAGGSDFRKDESFTVAKGVGPKLVGLVLADSGIGSKPITLKDW